MTRDRGMLSGTTAVIERRLGLEGGLRTKSAAYGLRAAPVGFDGLELVKAVYARIAENWDGSPGRSGELWRWTKQPHIASHHTGPEKTLEKAIVRAAPEWVNQIPAASGLLIGVEQGSASVDLGRQCGPGWFELVELKAGSKADTPLWAAFEILRYGLLYCFARARQDALYLPKALDLMLARRVDLKVLAPRTVYEGYRLGWLEQGLDDGLAEFSAGLFPAALALGFRFESFPPGFRWPDLDAGELMELLSARRQHEFDE